MKRALALCQNPHCRTIRLVGGCWFHVHMKYAQMIVLAALCTSLGALLACFKSMTCLVQKLAFQCTQPIAWSSNSERRWPWIMQETPPYSLRCKWAQVHPLPGPCDPCDPCDGRKGPIPDELKMMSHTRSRMFIFLTSLTVVYCVRYLDIWQAWYCCFSKEF